MNIFQRLDELRREIQAFHPSEKDSPLTLATVEALLAAEAIWNGLAERGVQHADRASALVSWFLREDAEKKAIIPAGYLY